MSVNGEFSAFTDKSCIYEADIAHPTIIKIESGAIQSPTVETAQRIERALGLMI
ncbi:helix-turn-helix domain-containing protein [Patescibacteria group bacterium]|nr:helix-turn-helix domain-containing protein [Patescibacteria group bacterium]MBU1612896.1 helix-turn-helix domain-containing protein [Patescibacteria group bacterium]